MTALLNRSIRLRAAGALKRSDFMSSFAKRLSRHLFMNAGVQGLNILTSLVIIAFLPFEEIAALAVVMLVAAPVAMLGTLRLQWILLNTSSSTAARIVYRAGVLSSLIAGPVALALMFAFRELGWFNFALPSTSLFILGSLYCVAFSVNAINLPWNLAQTSIRANMRVRLVHAAIRFVLSILLCVTLRKAEAVFIGEIGAALGALTITQGVRVLVSRTHGAILGLRWIWRHHRRMLLASTPSALLNSVATNLVPVIVISVVGEVAGGITYTVQRLAGIPVKFALSTVGEAWHKMIRRGDPGAVRLARNPQRLLGMMVAVFAATLLLLNAAAFGARHSGLAALDTEKVTSVISAVLAYQLFFAVTLAVNLFNRVLVMRSVIHRKLLFDVALFLTPLPLLLLPTYLGRPVTVSDALFTLSIFQFIAYGILAALILSEASRWSNETCALHGSETRGS